MSEKRLQRELDSLKKMILSLGAMVEERVRMAVKAIESRDADLAAEIIRTDYEIDENEVEVEEDCLKILALHQPVAVDLRFIIAVIKINNDLERVADEASNIAKCVQHIAGREKVEVPFDYNAMAQKAEFMVKRSLDALVNLDQDLAFRVLTLDDEVDQIHSEIHGHIRDAIVEHPARARYLINLLFISRYLERIADHATNLAEEVIYMIEGEIVRHGKWALEPKNPPA
ncbi:MAG: phosphate signaling complex protein PhoU [Thermodesulfobacteriota bacterium]|nr:phosphate signaling complex protein PhoU [Thermodesulfobacteriota bacterium]